MDSKGIVKGGERSGFHGLLVISLFSSSLTTLEGKCIPTDTPEHKCTGTYDAYVLLYTYLPHPAHHTDRLTDGFTWGTHPPTNRFPLIRAILASWLHFYINQVQLPLEEALGTWHV